MSKELTDLIELFGAVLGIMLSCVAGIRTVVRRYRAIASRTNELADLYKAVATDLLKSATSAARRADIHAYVLFRTTQIVSRRNQSAVYSIIVATMLLSLVIFGAIVTRLSDFTGHEFAKSFLWIMVGITFILFGIAYFAERRVWRIESGWMDTIEELLRDRAWAHAERSRISVDVS